MALPVTNHLRVLRAERGWSQAELAERLSVSRQTVNAHRDRQVRPQSASGF